VGALLSSKIEILGIFSNNWSGPPALPADGGEAAPGVRAPAARPPPRGDGPHEGPPPLPPSSSAHSRNGRIRGKANNAPLPPPLCKHREAAWRVFGARVPTSSLFSTPSSISFFYVGNLQRLDGGGGRCDPRVVPPAHPASSVFLSDRHDTPGVARKGSDGKCDSRSHPHKQRGCAVIWHKRFSDARERRDTNAKAPPNPPHNLLSPLSCHFPHPEHLFPVG